MAEHRGSSSTASTRASSSSTSRATAAPPRRTGPDAADSCDCQPPGHGHGQLHADADPRRLQRARSRPSRTTRRPTRRSASSSSRTSSGRSAAPTKASSRRSARFTPRTDERQRRSALRVSARHERDRQHAEQRRCSNQCLPQRLTIDPKTNHGPVPHPRDVLRTAGHRTACRAAAKTCRRRLRDAGSDRPQGVPERPARPVGASGGGQRDDRSLDGADLRGQAAPAERPCNLNVHAERLVLHREQRHLEGAARRRSSSARRPSRPVS